MGEGLKCCVLSFKISTNTNGYLRTNISSLKMGGLAQLARAPALHAGGHRFEPVHLHQFIGGDFDEIVKPMSRKIFVL